MLKYTNTDIVFQEIPDEVTLAVNLSGCPCHCPGCHSQYLWGDEGEPLTDERAEKGLPPVELRLDPEAAKIIPGVPAGEKDFDTEFLDYILAVAVVIGIVIGRGIAEKPAWDVCYDMTNRNIEWTYAGRK